MKRLTNIFYGAVAPFQSIGLTSAGLKTKSRTARYWF